MFLRLQQSLILKSQLRSETKVLPSMHLCVCSQKPPHLLLQREKQSELQSSLLARFVRYYLLVDLLTRATVDVSDGIWKAGNVGGDSCWSGGNVSGVPLKEQDGGWTKRDSPKATPTPTKRSPSNGRDHGDSRNAKLVQTLDSVYIVCTDQTPDSGAEFPKYHQGPVSVWKCPWCGYSVSWLLQMMSSEQQMVAPASQSGSFIFTLCQRSKSNKVLVTSRHRPPQTDGQRENGRLTSGKTKSSIMSGNNDCQNWKRETALVRGQTDH